MVKLFSWFKRTSDPRLASRPHPVHPGWPEATPRFCLSSGDVVQLRPLVYQDGAQWCAQRKADQDLLEPVEPTTLPNWDHAHSPAQWREYFASVRRAALRGDVIPFAIEVNGQFAGQLTLGNIQRGVVSECWVGYWVHSKFQHRGVATAACALSIDHVFTRVGLHRITATYLPGNEGSRRVLENTGFREEGFLKRNIHINGAWRDHHLVAITKGDYTTSAISRITAQSKGHLIRRGTQKTTT